MNCWKCASVLPDDANFCLHCGSAQWTACSICHERCRFDIATCPACGKGINIHEEKSAGLQYDSRSLQLTPALIERRQITVLFSDLVNSSSLTDQLDPEDLHDVMLTYQSACKAAVERFDGTIIRIVGDGILSGFGYPQTHEDDPERAIHAGLAIIDHIGDLKGQDHAKLQVRVGVATGMVVVSNVADMAAPEIFGSAPIWAVRLQGLAEPNSLAVADSTRQLVGSIFRYDDLGWHRLKGFAERLRAWRVLGTGDVNSRFSVFHIDGKLPPFVGREEELTLVLEYAEQARKGKGQAVLLSGEPGIGKTRLITALRDQLPNTRFIYLFCSPYHQNSALHPIVAMLEQTWRLSNIPAAKDRIAYLSTMVSKCGQIPAIVTPLLAKLFSIENADKEGTKLSPPREREVLLDAILAQLLLITDGQLGVIVIENAHWVDPTTKELIELLLQRCQERQILVLVTYRPERTFTWELGTNVALLKLERLEPIHSLTLAQNIAGECHLSDTTLERIAERSDGIPLFIEEMTKSILTPQASHDAIGEGSSFRSAEVVPATLRDSLMARLDRLNSPREIAQIGAVVGREFSYELIAAITQVQSQHLKVGLDHLVEAGILFQYGSPPQARYLFKHALLQDVAYTSLLRRKRKQLHKAIVDALESGKLKAPTATAFLAHHCVEAGLPRKAADYFFELGQEASKNSANVEAAAFFQSALDMLNRLQDNDSRNQDILKFLTALGPAVISTRGPGSPEAEAVYRRAVTLCQDLPDSEFTFAAHWGHWRISMDLITERERADRLLIIAYHIGDQGLKLQAHHCQWATLFNLGAQRECVDHIVKGLALYDQDKHRFHASQYGGHDPRVCGYAELALSQWILGFTDQAMTSLSKAETWAARLEHAGSIAHAMDFRIMLHRYRRDAHAVQDQATRMMAFAREQLLKDHEVKAKFFRGWAACLLGETELAVEDMENAMAEQIAIGTAEDFPVYYDMLAEIYQRQDRWPHAFDAVESGFSAARDSGLTYWNSELYRRRAELLWQSDQDDKAASGNLLEAIDIARDQGARMLELRATMTGVRFAKARTRKMWLKKLDAIVTTFTEGHAEKDLVEALTLLAS